MKPQALGKCLPKWKTWGIWSTVSVDMHFTFSALQKCSHFPTVWSLCTIVYLQCLNSLWIYSQDLESGTQKFSVVNISTSLSFFPFLFPLFNFFFPFLKPNFLRKQDSHNRSLDVSFLKQLYANLTVWWISKALE